MSLKRILLEEIYVDELASDFTSESYSLDYAEGFSIVAKSETQTIAPVVFQAQAVVGNLFVLVAHGLQTGLKVRISTSGTLPTGLAVLTDYYVIRNTADIIQLATTQSNALQGTGIVLSSSGTGTHTITVQQAVPVSIKLQASIDDVLWADISDSELSLNEEPILLQHDQAYYHFVRAKLICEAGQHDLNVKMMIRGTST